MILREMRQYPKNSAAVTIRLGLQEAVAKRHSATTQSVEIRKPSFVSDRLRELSKLRLTLREIKENSRIRRERRRE
jgi:hypothetical protein